MPDHALELTELLANAAANKALVKATFSSPRSPQSIFLRVAVRPIDVRGGSMLQFTSQTATQEFHKNLSLDEAANELVRLATKDFKNTHFTTDSASFEARFSKKGKCFLSKKPIATTTLTFPLEHPHNQLRNHLIPEGTPCPFLVETGIMSKTGIVLASHSRKFRQINRFLEFIHDIAESLPSDRTIRVIDFGCGKSYLTFATHYLLTTILKRDVEIIGLDRREDVVKTCSTIVERLGIQNLRFTVGDIASYVSNANVDMVISLHACDTATDEAIAQAIRWQSKAILAVPCCQHELNSHLSSSALAPLTSFGISKERFASLATDSMRVALLNAVGYQTQLLEFIETEHTPKNLLIRSVRNQEYLATDAKTRSSSDVGTLRALLGIPPLTLERRLVELGMLN
ncbi:MAG: SAM-dependent methyltransferase [Planctomycetota bacterium]|nr:SAM-dependent methyltransferase [Planctomycetota bacterium]